MCHFYCVLNGISICSQFKSRSKVPCLHSRLDPRRCEAENRRKGLFWNNSYNHCTTKCLPLFIVSLLIFICLFLFFSFFFLTVEQKPHQQGWGAACDLRAEQESAEKPFRLYTEDFWHHCWGHSEATWAIIGRLSSQENQVFNHRKFKFMSTVFNTVCFGCKMYCADWRRETRSDLIRRRSTLISREVEGWILTKILTNCVYPQMSTYVRSA